jgi:hypothetical protein
MNTTVVTLNYFFVLAATVVMWVAAFNPTVDANHKFSLAINWMCLSFALLLTAWFFK